METNLQPVEQHNNEQKKLSVDEILNGARQESSVKKIQEKKKVESNTKEEKSNLSSDAEPKETQSDNPAVSELEKLKVDLENSEKRRNDSSKAFIDLSQKVKRFEKKINQYLENGVLSDDEAKALLTETTHQDIDESEEEPLQRLFKIGNDGINKIRASIEEGLIDDDALLDKKVRSFDLFLSDASREELTELFDELSKLEKEPIKLAKKMMSVGQKYYEEIYGEIEESGNLRGFKQKYQSKIDSLQKTIDKQQKEILKLKEQYEGYIPSKTYNLTPGSGKEIAKEDKKRSVDDYLKAYR